MNCPVCQRSLAPTLSICPTCGAMMNDTVREEVQKNLTAGPAVQPQARELRTPPLDRVSRPVPSIPQPAPRVHTSGLVAPKTSPTLIEFSHKNKSIPEWRLQLQNAVQQRRGAQAGSSEKQPLAAADAARPIRVPAAAVVESTESMADPRVANAMRRITESRNTFLDPTPAPKRNIGARAEQPRPFGVVPASRAAAAVVIDRPRLPETPKPRLVNVTAPSGFKRDTNKLPRIEIGVPATDTGVMQRQDAVAEPLEEITESKKIHIAVEATNVEEPVWPADETEDIEDLAPLSMRFGAGLFDFIIGSFASMLLLSPLVFAGMEWLSWGGLLMLTGTVAVVLFLYMTASLGFFGKTAGMKLFSLELVDAVENEYPSIRQSAVNSSIFLLSIAFAGAGFLTMLFNEEKRALHDLLSGTILVREF